MNIFKSKAPEFAKIKDLIGKIPTSVIGANDGNELSFIFTDGSMYTFKHYYQDCCENVYIESIVGDLSDLIGVPLLKAYESKSGKEPSGYKEENYTDSSHTWTFYKFATVKGWVDVRWLGESNGYYSESVDLLRII